MVKTAWKVTFLLLPRLDSILIKRKGVGCVGYLAGGVCSHANVVLGPRALNGEHFRSKHKQKYISIHVCHACERGYVAVCMVCVCECVCVFVCLCVCVFVCVFVCVSNLRRSMSLYNYVMHVCAGMWLPL